MSDLDITRPATGHARTLALHVAPEMDLVTLYLQRYTRPQTIRAYRQDLTDFFSALLDLGSDISLAITLDFVRQISFVNVNRYLTHLEDDRKLSAATQRRRLSAIRGFFDWLIEQLNKKL